MRLHSITLFVAAVATGASSLGAHAHLVKSNPPANAVTANPATLSLTFSERLVPGFSKLELWKTMAGHNMAVPVKTAVAADGRTLIGTPQRSLMKGAYLIRWTAATSDGHKMTGSLPFRVG
jgi:methionine-rich copper-binding protein CopC